MPFSVIIPARYDSTRLPGKPLADIHGKPMIQWVYEKAILSGADEVIIATDDERIQRVVKSFSARVCMTSKSHQSGTERLAEVIDCLGIPPDHIVVNVQGDEPLIPHALIDQVASNLSNSDAPMATLSTPIVDDSDILNPNVVKVVCDKKGYAMYFSRAPIPVSQPQTNDAPPKTCPSLFRHFGIYAYRAGFIRKYLDWSPSTIEQVESLEQLRVLWHGEKIHVGVACEASGMGVDTENDLLQVRSLLQS